MSAFDQAIDIVLGHEGGFADNPADKGGVTRFGISSRAHPEIDVKSLTLDDAKRIYRAEYWDRIHGDDLDPALALVTFDAAVNNGVVTALRWLQRALGVTADGKIGPETLAAARKADPEQVLVDLHALRIHFMASLPGWTKFGRGWSKRLAHITFQAAGMAREA